MGSIRHRGLFGLVKIRQNNKSPAARPLRSENSALAVRPTRRHRSDQACKLNLQKNRVLTTVAQTKRHQSTTAMYKTIKIQDHRTKFEQNCRSYKYQINTQDRLKNVRSLFYSVYQLRKISTVATVHRTTLTKKGRVARRHQQQRSELPHEGKQPSSGECLCCWAVESVQSSGHTSSKQFPWEEPKEWPRRTAREGRDAAHRPKLLLVLQIPQNS